MSMCEWYHGSPFDLEWLITREPGVTLIGATTITPEELLTKAMLETIRGYALTKNTHKRLLDGNFRLRSFRASDQTETRQLVIEGLGERWGYIDETCNPDLDDIAAHYVSRGHSVILAEDDSGIIGAGTLTVEGEIAHMVHVSVRSSQRGRGVGSAIVEELIETALERGVRRIEVETNLDWYSAVRLYERHGFVEYDRDDESVYFAKELI